MTSFEFDRNNVLTVNNLNLNIGNKNFTSYTMDLTKKYIEINGDYRS